MTLSAKERRGARAAESDGLENRCPERDRGFESHPLRHTTGARLEAVLHSWHPESANPSPPKNRRVPHLGAFPFPLKIHAVLFATCRKPVWHLPKIVPSLLDGACCVALALLDLA